MINATWNCRMKRKLLFARDIVTIFSGLRHLDCHSCFIYFLEGWEVVECKVVMRFKNVQPKFI